jgi:UDPglucose 6-dehydrogenase
MVFCGEIDLLKHIFIGKKYVTMTSLEAEITKYAHNVFGALKVTYFNGIYELAEKNGCNYENIKNGFLLSGYINDTHTFVPGPDGKFGYGGKCFPKDVNSFAKYTEGTYLSNLIKPMIGNNDYYRNKNNNKG